jgi:hypothetical protein
MKRNKTWIERLNEGTKPEVKPAPVDIAGMKAGQMMLLPTPRLIDQFIRSLPRGSSMTAKELRVTLARQHGAEVTCPIMTGFHLRTVAEAAWEALNAGTPVSKLTPVWRVLPPDSLTLKKLSFDTAFVRRQRELEGLEI